MPFPRNNEDFRAALSAYDPPAVPGEGESTPEERAEAETFGAAIGAAKARSSIVDQCALTFNALHKRPDLTLPELSLLLGAAYLINKGGGWYQLGPEATEVLTERAAEFAAMEAEAG